MQFLDGVVKGRTAASGLARSETSSVLYRPKTEQRAKLKEISEGVQIENMD